MISDEAHRSISGNARSVFDYFVGYKLGLTATPRDFLKGTDNTADPREIERRLILDTYRTFGCDSGEPTFRYSLVDGVRDGVLISPIVVDARTEVTAELLSDEGFRVDFTDEETGDSQETAYGHRDFERRFFSDATNRVFCRTFLDQALRDPLSGEIGKSVIFAVSQSHAARLANVFNEMAGRMFPGRYNSDFAVQVTSHVAEAQQFALNFANNNLMGSGNIMPEYRTGKARICVTVGMMTTGYDCPDLLNLGLFRPIFSPTDFIQIKGRGTRRHNFLVNLTDADLKADISASEKKDRMEKTAFKLFDFFANCEYFEEEFKYDEILQLPKPVGDNGNGGSEDDQSVGAIVYRYLGDDSLESITEQQIGAAGMRIDRMFFDRFADTVRGDAVIVSAVEEGRWDNVAEYIRREVFDRPEEYYTLEKLRHAASVDRRLTLREIVEQIFGLIAKFKSKDELLDEEFAKFIADFRLDASENIVLLRNFFKAYAANAEFRGVIDSRRFVELATNPAFSFDDFLRIPDKYRRTIPEYIKDYVSLNQFAG